MRTVPAKCRNCDKAFERPFRRGGTQRFCNAKCRTRFRYLRLNHRPEKPCLHCGATIQPGSHSNKDYCSRACKKAVDSVKAVEDYRRRYKTDLAYRDRFHRHGHLRRARIQGTRAEPFSPLSVLERDGWVCQICGVETPKSLRGVRVRNAPTLDHIIPLARGGSHTSDNTQCACLRCNTSKGAKLQEVA